MRGLGFTVVGLCVVIAGSCLASLLASGHPYQALVLLVAAVAAVFLATRRAL